VDPFKLCAVKDELQSKVDLPGVEHYCHLVYASKDVPYPFVPETLCTDSPQFCQNDVPDPTLLCDPAADYSAVTGWRPDMTCKTALLTEVVCSDPDMSRVCSDGALDIMMACRHLNETEAITISTQVGINAEDLCFY